MSSSQVGSNQSKTDVEPDLNRSISPVVTADEIEEEVAGALRNYMKCFERNMKIDLSDVIKDESLRNEVEKKLNNQLEHVIGLSSGFLSREMYEKHQFQKKYGIVRLWNQDLVNGKILLKKFSRMLIIPDKLRHAMEFFPIRVLPSVEQSFHRQSDLHTKLRSMIDPTWKVDLIKQSLMLLTKTSEAVTDKRLESVWNRLKTLQLDVSNVSISDLGKAIIEFSKTPDFNAAKMVYEKQIDDIWSPRKLELFDTDEKSIQELCELSIENVLESLMNNAMDASKKSWIKSAGELAYLCDGVTIGKIFRDDTSKRYKETFWILYTSNHSIIKKIKATLKTEWPDLSERERMDRYCSEFTQLFNIVSTLSKHGPGLQIPVGCEPTKADFSAYINHLAVTESVDLSIVANTLYKPLDN